MSIKQLSENYKSIPWKEYINTIFKPVAEICDDEIVIVKVPNYFKEFEKLMNQTPKRTVANYAMWKAVDDSIDYLPDKIRKREMQYVSEIIGQTSRKPRWRECMEFTSDNFGITIGALYVRKYFSTQAKKSASKMVVAIQNEFQKILQKVR